jgi:hypothetical protein
MAKVRGPSVPLAPSGAAWIGMQKGEDIWKDVTLTIALLALVQREGEALVLPADRVNAELLNGAGGLLQEMISNPFFGAL